MTYAVSSGGGSGGDDGDRDRDRKRKTLRDKILDEFGEEQDIDDYLDNKDEDEDEDDRPKAKRKKATDRSHESTSSTLSSIAARAKARSTLSRGQEGKRKSLRSFTAAQEALDGSGGGRSSQPKSYVEPKQRGVWDSQRRATYDPATWQYVLSRMQRRGELYVCPECGEAFARYDPRRPHVNGITIDHDTNFRDYINDNAAPNDDGNISSSAARAAYNDVNNLRGMCRNCNSGKSGPKGKY
ncbi:hypothetical protein AB0M36_16745 [Actinoplanes sp. NPDC051346]|uniref:hypothetical protein n=1 Tax=Actinoplanes sp. NPDC051346 TaxID=3155048 RepID=UPI00343B2845